MNCREVKDRIDTPHGLNKCLGFAHITAINLKALLLQSNGVLRRQRQHANRASPGAQRANKVRADETSSSRDQGYLHRCPPSELVVPGPLSCSMMSAVIFGS